MTHLKTAPGSGATASAASYACPPEADGPKHRPNPATKSDYGTDGMDSHPRQIDAPMVVKKFLAISFGLILVVPGKSCGLALWVSDKTGRGHSGEGKLL